MAIAKVAAVRVIFYLVLFGLLAGSVELASWSVYTSALVLPEPIYRPEYFDCGGCQKKADVSAKDLMSGPNPFLGWDLYDHDLGWDSYRNGKRNAPRTFVNVCASAFGDSFVHGDEVEDHEAWVYLLSQHLNCEVENFGVGGYGLDQAFLKYLKYRPRGDVVIVGVTQEALRRNFAASWRFYASLPNSLPKPFFRLQDGKIELERAPTDLDRESIRRHHLHDRYAKPFVVKFPYSIALARVLFYRASKSAYERNRIEPYGSVWTDADATVLSFRILQEFARTVTEDGKTLVVVAVPTPESIVQGFAIYAHYFAELKKLVPAVCILEPLLELQKKYSAVGSLQAPKGHFNQAGNEVIAAAIFVVMRNSTFKSASCREL